MKILKISVTGLHGFIDAELSLGEELAIIVGMNGAGKTSLLNLTANLLKLDVESIANTDFQKFELSGRVGKKAFAFSAVRTNGAIDLQIKESSKSIGKHRLELPKRDDISFEDRSVRFAYERAVRRSYDRVSESRIAEYLRANVRLTLVKLDRTLFAEESDGVMALESPAVSRRLGSQEAFDPIARVSQVTSDRYNRYRVASKVHSEALMREIILQLFKSPEGMFKRSRAAAKLTSAQIENIRKKIARMPYFAEGAEFSSQIGGYFELALAALQADKKRSAKPSEEDIEKHFVQMLFKDLEFPRIEGLLKAFEAFEVADSHSRSELDRFETLVNSFLVEGGKEVFFSEKEASLRFRLKNSANSVGRSIAELSSGERQIVTVLTYLAFMAGAHSIFVVDEPELSLHLSWQMKLVDALMKLRPEDGQLILATHSPEIVGKHRKCVVDLAPVFREREA